MSEIIAEFEKLGNTVIESTEELRGRIEMLEAKNERPVGTDVQRDETREEKEYRKAFLTYLSHPNDSHRKAQLDEMMGDFESKDIVTGTDASGGYALPKVIGSDIHAQLHDLNQFRQWIRVQNVTTTDYQELVAHNDNGAGWVSETGSRAATDTPSFRNRKPTHGEQYAYLQVSNWALDDLQFNVQEFLVRQTSRLFAQMEQVAIVSGTGSDQPTGFLNGTTVTTTDNASPLRSAEVLEHITTGTSPAAVSYDALIDLITAVHEGYLASPKVAFCTNRSTLAVVQKLKDSDGRPLWQPSLIAGQPSMLLGFPLFTSAAMPTGSGNDVIAFGDWSSAYLFVQRVDMRLIVDPVTNPGHHRFYIASRVGGIVLDNNAVKTMKLV